MKKIQLMHYVTYGCDPEILLTDSEGHLRGSELVIPEKGTASLNGRGEQRVIRDGVQAELNPTANQCRAYLCQNIAESMYALEQALKGTQLQASTKGVLTVNANHLNSLSQKSKELGCAPSKNLHGTIAITEEQKQTRVRSAGGHIHLGYNYKDINPKDTVLLMDLLVGNTAVLLDRDESQKERRKYYGRAGEYRLPKHGLEYRTPSNFWLRAYPLMSLMMGLSRLSFTLANPVLHAPKHKYQNEWNTQERLSNMFFKEDGDEVWNWIKSKMDTKKIQLAINENDFDLAMENHELTEEIIRQFVPNVAEQCLQNGTNKKIETALTTWASINGTFPLIEPVLDTFRFFVKKGIDYWFTENIFDAWTKYRQQEGRKIDPHKKGWESFLVNTVYPEYINATKPAESK